MAKKEVAVGIDIGGTNTVFGFVDREGNISWVKIKLENLSL
jgi:predicted NBD/HSP70 family sugar kinase